MKSQELRIGNWVNSETYGDFQIVAMNVGFTNSILFKSLEYYPQSSVLNKCKPIPITDEWMPQLNFQEEKNGQIKVFFKGIDESSYYAYIHITFDILMVVRLVIDECIYDLDIKYVHQLQNIYHSLTGQEL